MDCIRFLRFPQVSERTGRTRPSLNYLIQNGQFPRPIKVSARAAAFPEYEVEAVMNAQIRGFSVDQIKGLVSQIHAQRREVSV